MSVSNLIIVWDGLASRREIWSIISEKLRGCCGWLGNLHQVESEGNKYLEANVSVAAINHLDIQRFLSYLKGVPWPALNVDSVQVLHKGEEEDCFTLFNIWPYTSDLWTRLSERTGIDRQLCKTKCFMRLYSAEPLGDDVEETLYQYLKNS